MSAKSVYLYQVTMGHDDREEETVYVYARNAGLAVDELKNMYKDKKYNTYRSKMFGQADIKVHPKPFEMMSNEEVAYILTHGLAKEKAYAQRNDSMPAGEFVPVDKMEEVLNKALSEGESV